MSPSSIADNEHWTDGDILMSLSNFKTGEPLFSHVEFQVNPFQNRPQDLPGDLLYFGSGVEKESEFGFWVETGDSCDIFSNSAIHGYTTTLNFYEDRAPHGRKTNWMMQEYRITEKCKNNVNDHGALYRVFLADKESSEIDCILTGDYLELNDLVDDRASRSSRSANSSCLTDEYFDYMALLQQIDDDE